MAYLSQREDHTARFELQKKEKREGKMGTYMQSFSEIRDGDKWDYVDDEIFPYQKYGLFEFLAGVRPYSGAPSISSPRGLPEDVSWGVMQEEGDNYHHYSHSWLSVEELLNHNYDVTFEDLRSNGDTLSPGQGKVVTLREFLGDSYFRCLEKLKQSGAQRVVFWFH